MRIPWMMALLLSLVVIGGCWDRREVNDMAIVIAMAMDKEPNGSYRLSVQVPLVSNLGGPSGGGGGGKSGGKSFYVDSAVGTTIREANNTIQSRMSRHLYYAHHRVVVIGEKLAKEGFSDALDIVSRFPENRLTAYIVMTKGRAIDLLNAEPQFERFSGEAIREIVKSESIPVTIKDISQMLNTPGVDAFLPIFAAVDTHPKGKSKELESVGIGTFRKDKLIATYTNYEMAGLRWFHRTEPLTMNVNLGPKKILSISFQNARAKVNPSFAGGHIHFNIEVHGSAYVTENHSSLDLSQEVNSKLLEDKLSQQIKNDVKKVMEQIKQTKSDTIGLGIVLARNFPKEWKEKYRSTWDKEIPKITYQIKSKVQVVDIGQTTKNIMKEEDHS
ncbi:Ger(x)C family spore germination protein [Brevibacillus reuszeri]|nr:Ger(x)C family spore germination protein [Brevibacillus reuszeri]KNB72658.1 spore gernimation protein [Brevibacillus reuszeri]MED1860645.1 Ger(x)C family spore germination protein [Brevibacillus reuszeri]